MCISDFDVYFRLRKYTSIRQDNYAIVNALKSCIKDNAVKDKTQVVLRFNLNVFLFSDNLFL